MFLRSRKHGNHAVVFVTRASANVGMVLARSRMALTELDAKN